MMLVMDHIAEGRRVLVGLTAEQLETLRNDGELSDGVGGPHGLAAQIHLVVRDTVDQLLTDVPKILQNDDLARIAAVIQEQRKSMMEEVDTTFDPSVN